MAGDEREGGEHGPGTACCGACEYAAHVASEPALEARELGPPLLAPRGEPPRITLIVTHRGEPSSRVFDKAEVTVGRVNGNDLVLASSNVSKRTCRFSLVDGKLFVVDLKSTCGTYVNGRLIHSPTMLREGDRVFVGDYVLTPSLAR